MTGPSMVAVHVTVESFFDPRVGRRIEDLLALTGELDRVLSKHASRWSRPSADEALLVGEPPWRAPATPLDWATAVLEDVGTELGVDVSIGIASTRVVARVCSRLARPRGILLWLPGHEAGLIAELPLEELDELRSEQLSRLRVRGVRTLGEMARLVPEEARSLLGSEAVKLLSLVRGVERPSDGPKTGRLASAAGVLSRRLARRLCRAGVSARGLEMRGVYADGVSRECYMLLPRPTTDFEELRRAAARLVAMFPLREEPIVGLSLAATGLATERGQLGLFGMGCPRELTVRLGRARPS